MGEVVSADAGKRLDALAFRVPDALARFIAAKGSVAVDGVSLTVNEVQGSTLRREHHSAHRRGHQLRHAARRAIR